MVEEDGVRPPIGHLKLLINIKINIFSVYITYITNTFFHYVSDFTMESTTY